MTTLVELNKLVRDVINASISITDVIVANPNAPRPKDDFATVYVAEMTQDGISDIEYSSNALDIDEKVVRMFETRVSINFFRNNARMNAAIFLSSMSVNSILEIFNASYVGFIRASSIRELTQVFNSSQEERAQLDIFLSFELTPPVELVTGIDTAIVQGTIDNSQQVIETVDITVP